MLPFASIHPHPGGGTSFCCYSFEKTLLLCPRVCHATHPQCFYAASFVAVSAVAPLGLSYLTYGAIEKSSVCISADESELILLLR